MSSNWSELSFLILFAKIRRLLNRKATQLLKPMGIGPKQALLIRELRAMKTGRLSDLAQVTHTDPASTGKAVDSLMKRGWVKRTDDPNDRRSHQVSLSAEGARAALKIESIFGLVAKDLCCTLSKREAALMYQQFKGISQYLEDRLDATKESP